jgi:preprotein translocase subunit SecA
MLWIDHLENLDSLRESVNIRAYGQHEPLVEYRREAHGLYQRLLQAFEQFVFNSVFSIFELDASKMAGDAAPQPARKTAPEAKEIGRNDPCYCGSGKKFKKCHGK